MARINGGKAAYRRPTISVARGGVRSRCAASPIIILF